MAARGARQRWWLHPTTGMSELTRQCRSRTNKQTTGYWPKEVLMNKEQVGMNTKVTMTVSCPLELHLWLKRTQRNVSAYVVQAIEALKTTQWKEEGE
jgi:hypothetical protein